MTWCDIRVKITQSDSFTELTAQALYAILRIRVNVFVVEQRCPYPELDGRDTEPGTRHVHISEDGTTVAYLRVLTEPDGSFRIGRVCTDRHRRGEGLAGALMREALAYCGDTSTVRLDAQASVAGFYRSFGFVIDGDEFVEDGIPHVPMTRAPEPKA
ncbi:Putative N-acetyltransferase YjcF [Stackebrandtia soli]